MIVRPALVLLGLSMFACGSVPTEIEGPEGPGGEVPPNAVAALADHRPGEAPPAWLLVDRPREGCLPRPDDTTTVFSSIGDPELLVAVVEAPGASRGAAEHALERALLLRGPSWVFQRIDPAGRLPLVEARAREKQVWVSASAAMNESQEPPEAAYRTIRELADRVGHGEAWGDVYEDLFRRHAALVNEGDFVLSESHPSARPFRDVAVPIDTVHALLDAAPGDVVVVRERVPHDAYRVAAYEVKEIFAPAP